jgi:hypothetical protein
LKESWIFFIFFEQVHNNAGRVATPSDGADPINLIAYASAIDIGSQQVSSRYGVHNSRNACYFRGLDQSLIIGESNGKAFPQRAIFVCSSRRIWFYPGTSVQQLIIG